MNGFKMTSLLYIYHLKVARQSSVHRSSNLQRLLLYRQVALLCDAHFILRDGFVDICQVDLLNCPSLSSLPYARNIFSLVFPERTWELTHRSHTGFQIFTFA